MNRVARHRLTVLISAMCIPVLLTAAAPTASATVSAPTAPTAIAVSCPAGWFCFFDETNFGTPRGKLSDCGWQDLADYQWRNRIEAVYYNLSEGSAAFYESNGTYLFQVSAANRSISDVAPRQNKADKVYRTCPS